MRGEALLSNERPAANCFSKKTMSSDGSIAFKGPLESKGSA
jgi:hypothetical protein